MVRLSAPTPTEVPTRIAVEAGSGTSAATPAAEGMTAKTCASKRMPHVAAMGSMILLPGSASAPIISYKNAPAMAPNRPPIRPRLGRARPPSPIPKARPPTAPTAAQGRPCTSKDEAISTDMFPGSRSWTRVASGTAATAAPAPAAAPSTKPSKAATAPARADWRASPPARPKLSPRVAPISPMANAAFLVPAVARSSAPGARNGELLNPFGVAVGLKLSNVVSISSHETSAAAAPAASAQWRTRRIRRSHGCSPRRREPPSRSASRR